MLRPSPLASSATSSRLHPPTSDHFSLVLRPQINPRLLSSLSVSVSVSVSSRRCHSPFVCCARSPGRVGVVEIVKEVDAEAEGEGGKADEEVAEIANADGESVSVSVGIGNPSLFAGRAGLIRMSMGDRAFFLLAFVAATTSIAFTSFVVAAIPTLLALKRTAKSLAKLADTACVELPSTMAAIRLSGLEISDLTVELSDLSQEMADSINKSTLAVKAAGAGIKQIGAVAHEKTMSLIEERANLPEIPIQPFVAGAARKTSHAVGQAANNLMGYLSGNNNSSNGSSSRKHKPSASSSRQGRSSVPPSKTGKPKPSIITES